MLYLQNKPEKVTKIVIFLGLLQPKNDLFIHNIIDI